MAKQAHCNVVGNCNGSKDCDCPCGPCNNAARQQLDAAWKTTIQELKKAYELALDDVRRKVR